MKAVISTTYDDIYLYSLPIVVWCWHKLNVDTICFMPYLNTTDENNKIDLINDTFKALGIKPQYAGFSAPKDKEVTYAQCSRLYAGCLDLPFNELLVTSDVDMAVFKVPPYVEGFTIFGKDLVPNEQVPMCYICAYVVNWKKVFKLAGETYQSKLDSILEQIECLHFRGNYWGKDQQEAWEKIYNFPENIINEVNRARPNTQFATNRIDRDDSFWEERLNLEVIDAHLWRPGYTDENFPKILKLLRFFYPHENFDWLISYTQQYKQLL